MSEARFSPEGLPLSPIDEQDGWTEIKILTPVPAGLAGVLMNMFGAVWPETTIQNGGAQSSLTFRVPWGITEDQKLTDEVADSLRQDASGDHEPLTFLGFREGEAVFAPPEDLCLALGEFAHLIMSSHMGEQAINHLEWEVRTPEAPMYVLSISRSNGQTPLAMRKAAEAEVDRLKAILDKEGIEY